ncbi:protection of telomeres protein 1 isoform X2 [Osmerus mordax]|uniref:protection of telomeres protein 1 isoform X2 n=1 Tax=Osmerus mordax TaxID=8014 RepID=UPI00350EE0AD
MPVHVVKDGVNPESQVLGRLQKIAVPLLSTSLDCTDKIVKGKVVHKGPLVTVGTEDYVLKSVIQEEDSQHSLSSENTSINVILVGALAKEFSESVNQGDVMAVSGFRVGKSPTALKDKLHPCNLHLAGDEARVYVFPSSSLDPRASVANKRAPLSGAEVSKSAKVPKYSYVRLGDLQPGVVVNVYAVVTFFKQPFHTRGTDYCSSLKIIDQSNEKVACSIFSSKLDSHPKIFKTGDIIRLHRVKTQLFNGSKTLVTSHGFSVVTFDGAVGSAVTPRTSSLSSHFDEDDRRAVESLRAWAVAQLALPAQAGVTLAAVQPKVFFDLTCQLLAKAPMDSSCTLLKVWDGTKCSHPLLNVFVEPHLLEGCSTLSKDMENLTANILVYDNHVQAARQLKPGAYLRIYNIHPVPGASKVPGNHAGQSGQADHLAFHLHGGNSYGRGIQVLPDDSVEIQELKRVIGSSPEPDSNDMSDFEDFLDVWSTPPESFDSTGERSATERSCSHRLGCVTLAEAKGKGPPGVYHVKAQLKSYQPLRLFQSLKLYCHKCKTIREVPDDVTIGSLFLEAQRDAGPCREDWTVATDVDRPGDCPAFPHRTLTLHLPTHSKRRGAEVNELVFIKGATFEETCCITPGFKNVIPVRSSQGSMSLLDLSAPFLFRGKRHYFGCKQCSHVDLTQPFGQNTDVLDDKAVAEGLGVQLLAYGLMMQLELQDGTGSLEALLWRDAEQFFRVSPDGLAANTEAQGRVQETMDKLCPSGRSMAEHPWLDLCLSAYAVEENGQTRTCYQICHTHSTNPES